MRTRNKPSRLNQPEVIRLIHRFTVSRLKTTDARDHSLQRLCDRIAARFQIKVHKSTLQRFLKELGLNFAWEKRK